LGKSIVHFTCRPKISQEDQFFLSGKSVVHFACSPKYILLLATFNCHESNLFVNGISLLFHSSCLSAHMYQHGYHWMDFLDIWYWGLYENVKKIKIWLKLGRNIGHFTSEYEYILLLAATLNGQKSTLFEWNGIRQ
jgi:hypothetical protein